MNLIIIIHPGMKKNKISPDGFLLHRLVGALSGTIDPSVYNEHDCWLLS